MEENKINALMDMTVSKIRQLVDADTIIGKPINTPDGITVIPVSRMSFGIGTGGTTGSKGISFTGGNGDFVTLFEPTATEVAQAGKGYILASIGQESGEIPYTAYFASQAYINDHADIVQRFTNAIARAQKWIAEHDAAETAEIIAPQFPDTSVPVLTQVVQRYKDIDAWNTTPVMTQSSLERLETVMETAGVLNHADWVDFDRLVDNSYAHNAS